MQCNFNQIAIVLWNSMCSFWILKLLSLDQQLSFRSLYHLLFVFSGFSWVFRRRNHSNNKDVSTMYPSNSTALLHSALKDEKNCTIRNSSQKLYFFVEFLCVCVWKWFLTNFSNFRALYICLIHCYAHDEEMIPPISSHLDWFSIQTWKKYKYVPNIIFWKYFWKPVNCISF